MQPIYGTYAACCTPYMKFLLRLSSILRQTCRTISSYHHDGCMMLHSLRDELALYTIFNVKNLPRLTDCFVQSPLASASNHPSSQNVQCNPSIRHERANHFRNARRAPIRASLRVRLAGAACTVLCYTVPSLALSARSLPVWRRRNQAVTVAIRVGESRIYRLRYRKLYPTNALHQTEQIFVTLHIHKYHRTVHHNARQCKLSSYWTISKIVQ